MPDMIRRVFLNGQVSSLLVLDEGTYEEGITPIIKALKDQAERIEVLEQQNSDLIKQEKILLRLLEMTSRTDNLMDSSLKTLRRLEAQFDKKPEEGL